MAQSKTEKLITNLFKLLKIEGDFKAEETEEEIKIEIESEDSGIIIGYHGETLEALELILAFMCAKQNDQYKRVFIEVGGYKKNRTEWLEKLALETKEKAISQSREVHLHDLKSWERRIIHLFLKDDKEVSSESTGEGRERALVVKPR
ncbi:KH domain-containing protein [Patescibacteria group bacterium]|nr:KH domain-containing protein [Patescibacteria group bacterium]